jgi:hypothetical protein
MYVQFYAIHMYLHVCDYQYVLSIYICVCVRIRALKIMRGNQPCDLTNFSHFTYFVTSAPTMLKED